MRPLVRSGDGVSCPLYVSLRAEYRVELVNGSGLLLVVKP